VSSSPQKWRQLSIHFKHHLISTGFAKNQLLFFNHQNHFIMQTLNNSVKLIGNLGKDVEIRQFESGSKKASFSLATSDKYKNAKGESVETTQWHNIIAWGNVAEQMANALKKGSRVSIDGEIQYRKYTDGKGTFRNIAEIKVNEFTAIRDSE
jgi:single-strand DNA-binding protein